MKKIFINNSRLFICDTDENPFINNERVHRFEIRSKEELEKRIKEIEDSSEEGVFIATSKFPKRLEKDFFSLYKPITAAGGTVLNEKDELLMIFRRGKWDLPKGKVDKGETIRKAALREVREETGIDSIRIVSSIKFSGTEQDCTYHTYMMKGIRVVKATYWFKMKSKGEKKLVPQSLEDIEKAEWCSRVQIEEHLKNSYRSIQEVVSQILR